MNMVSHIADDNRAQTAQEVEQLCRDMFEHVCRTAFDPTKTRAVVHMRQDNGKAAPMLRTKDGGELIVHQKGDETFRLGFRMAVSDSFRDETIGRQTVSTDMIEWIAEEAQGKLVYHNVSRLLSLKF